MEKILHFAKRHFVQSKFVSNGGSGRNLNRVPCSVTCSSSIFDRIISYKILESPKMAILKRKDLLGFTYAGLRGMASFPIDLLHSATQ